MWHPGAPVCSIHARPKYTRSHRAEHESWRIELKLLASAARAGLVDALAAAGWAVAQAPGAGVVE